jgi:glycosyltransferase involved in cell wall biosynthesis
VSVRPELVLLTAAYPFGRESEPFLEPEVEVLADRFERVYVLPSHREEGLRVLPSNVELVEMDWLEGSTRAEKLRAIRSRDAAWVIAQTLRRSSKRRAYARGWRVYLDILAQNLVKLRLLQTLVTERRLSGAVFYDHWFENSTLAIALLRRSGSVRAAVARAHRFDIYDELWNDRPVPFREVKAALLDAVFPVSDSGARYLAGRVPFAQEKLVVHRLGVRDPGRPSPVGDEAAPLIVTCARLTPRKRVHEVPEVLASLGRPVRWVHLGDGPERERVVDAASQLGDHVAWELRGQVDHADVLRFYERNHVDALLSLSESEGLPVSMMEAQSYGIPVVARGVQGVPEIVTAETGVLLAPGAATAEAATALATALVPGRFEPEAVRAAFRDRYEAKANYNRFADALIALASA